MNPTDPPFARVEERNNSLCLVIGEYVMAVDGQSTVYPLPLPDGRHAKAWTVDVMQIVAAILNKQINSQSDAGEV